MSVFGPLVHAGEMENATVLQLKKWLPSYLLELSDRNGTKLAMPQSFSIVSDYANWPEQGLPAIVVESAGLVDEPDHDGQGFLSGTFAVEVTAAVQGPDAIVTRDLAMNYGLAVIAALMQHRKLADGITVSRCLDMAFGGASVEKRRTRIAVATVFHVYVKNFLNTSEGPLTPTEIPDDWPIVDTVEVEVEQQETDD